MRKIVLLLSVVVLAFTACSKSEEASEILTPKNLNGDLLVKRIIERIPDNYGNYGYATYDFTYDGKKIVKCARLYSANDNRLFYYTGDLLTKINFYSLNSLVAEVNFIYNSENKLTKCTYRDVEFGHGEQMEYIHMQDGRILYKNYTWERNNPDLRLRMEGTIYNDKNAYNIIGASGVIEFSDVVTFVLDGKNHPFKNVTGFDKISFVPATYFEFVSKPSSKSKDVNLTSLNFQQNISLMEANNGFGTLYNVVLFEYNSYNYPVLEIVKELASIEVARREYIYE